MPSLLNSVLIDVVVGLTCACLLARFARLSITHPATIYLGFHFCVVTLRAIAIIAGAPTLFSNWSATLKPVTSAEIARAVILSDLALIVMTSAWIIVARRASVPPVSPVWSRELNGSIINAVSFIVIPVGWVALLYWSRLPGLVPHQPAGDWATSSWPLELQMWAGLGLIALIYWYGFRPWLAVLITLYLAVMAYQGFHRFRVLIPLILLTQIYVDRRGRRWPRFSGFALLLLAGMLFFPLKEIGQRFQSGESAQSVLYRARLGVIDAVRVQNPDQMILDQFASALTLTDRHGKLYLGRTYLGLLTVAVPRQWWPEKPGLADFEKEISTRERPLAQSGMVVTMLGEFYLNFGYFGVVVMSFAVAYTTGSWFHAAYRRGYFTLEHFMYLLVACNLIEVFRDGLISLFVFTVINMLPLTLIVVIHVLRRPSLRVTLQHRREPILKTPRVRPAVDGESIA